MPVRVLSPARAVTLLVLLAVAAAVAVPVATAASAPHGRAILAFLPQAPAARPGAGQPSVLGDLARRRELSLGLLQDSQGGSDLGQTLLDIGQGARLSMSAYSPVTPPPLRYVARGAHHGRIANWRAVVRRARNAPASVVPGLLAQAVPGGAGYGGVAGRGQAAAVVAADRRGVVPAVSLGPPRTLARRAERLLGRHRLVVVSLPAGRAGLHALDALIGRRARDEELIAVRAPTGSSALRLLPVGLAGGPAAPGAPGRLTSPTTRRDGIVTAIDLAPTILEHLGIPVPRDMTGTAMRVEPGRSAAALRRTAERLAVTLPRRVPTIEIAAAAWLVLVLLLGLVAGRRGRRAAMRIGALACVWLPSTALLPPLLAPTAAEEYLLIVGGALALGALTDRLTRWPTGPAAPAFAGLLLYTVDLARGSPLIAQSVLGPDPRSGSRFYGIGNELEPILPIMLFFGLAAVLAWRGSRRRQAWAFGLAGAALAVVIGSGALGADVGGVVTVSVGTAVAVLSLLLGRGPDGRRGRLSRRALVLAVLTPVLALAALAALDLLTGANGHFTRDFIHTGGGGSRLEVIARKLDLAGRQFDDVAMSLATALALLAAGYAIRFRERVLGSLWRAPAWRAAFAGGLGGGIAGALANDSGPLLFVAAVVALGTLVPYVRGRPERAAVPVAGDDAVAAPPALARVGPPAGG